MATYVNDLRLKEIATGDEAGTWGTSTNTNLELIGEALGYGTQDCFSSDADATTTVADGATDPARAMYFKVTSSATLSATRTLTIAPNTISRVMFIENATTGSQSINISQGSGANVTIATGKTAVVYLDGAGSGAAVVNAMALVDPGVTDTLAEVLTAGNTSGGTGLTMSSGDDLTLTGASYNAVWDSSDSALEFADNAKAIFGAGSDLQIYHDGSHSYLYETGTGEFRIKTNGNIIQFLDNSNNYLIRASVGADVGLYHNTAQKLATTSTGIDVTGTTVTDGLTSAGDAAITGSSSGSTVLTLTSNALADTPLMVFQRTGGAVAGKLAYEDSNTAMSFGTTTAHELKLLTSNTERLQIDSSGNFIFNELSADADFRVESNNNANMLFVDAGNDRIGIGTASPGTQLNLLEVTSNTTTRSNQLRIEAQSSGTTGVGFGANIQFRGERTNGTIQTMGLIGFAASTNTSSNLSSDFVVETASSGTAAEHFRVTSGGSVGIGTGSGVDATLHVQEGGEPGSDGTLILEANSASRQLQFAPPSDAANGYVNYKGGNLVFQDDGTEVFRFQGASSIVVNDPSNDMDFRVESNNNSAMLFVDGGNDVVSVGYGASVAMAGERHELEVFDTNFSVISGATFRNGSDGASLTLGHSRSGTIGTQTVLQDDDIMGQVLFVGSDGTDFANIGAFVRASVDGTPGTDDMPGRLTFATTADGANSATERMRITSGGDIGAGTNNPQVRMHVQSDTNQNAMIVDGIGTAANYIFDVRDDGSTLFRVTPSTVVANENSADLDFRIESDGNANMLFVDGGNNRVGIMTGSPESDYPMTITGAGGSQLLLRSTGDTGYTQGSMVIASGTTSTPESRGQGVYYFNEGQDRTWYAGTLYQAGDHFGIGTTTGTTQQNSAADNANALMHIATAEITLNENSNDQDFRVESNGNASMLFVDAGNDRVGIGTSGPEEILHVYHASGSAAIRVSGEGNVNRKCEIEYDSTDGPIVRAGSSGIVSLKFAVDNTTIAGKFDTNADFYTNDGTVHSLSDIRVKTNVEDLVDGLDIVKQLKPRTFRYTEDSEFYNEDTKDEIRYGFVANEVEAVAPQYTDTGKGKIGGEEVDDLKSLSTTKMIPMLVKAIQEQQEQIEKLKSEIATLKGE